MFERRGKRACRLDERDHTIPGADIALHLGADQHALRFGVRRETAIVAEAPTMRRRRGMRGLALATLAFALVLDLVKRGLFARLRID